MSNILGAKAYAPDNEVRICRDPLAEHRPHPTTRGPSGASITLETAIEGATELALRLQTLNERAGALHELLYGPATEPNTVGRARSEMPNSMIGALHDRLLDIQDQINRLDETMHAIKSVVRP